MNLLTVASIGVGLSMDACALTIANCTTFKNRLNKTQQWSMPVLFAVFQGLMPLLGYFIGTIFASYLISVKDFLIAGVFYALSIKIVADIIKEKRNCKDDSCEIVKFNYGLLLVQALATSIDALLIGVTMSLGLQTSIFVAVGLIAVITFALVTLALFIGKMFGKILGDYAQWAGAVILFVLATVNLISAF